MVPTYDNISAIYTDAASEVERYKKIGAKHKAKYGVQADFVVRAPGRVNLIGDHIDYCYFSCLPMAIACDTVVAVTICDEHTVSVTNLDSDEYEDFSFQVPTSSEIVEISREVLHWGNYLKAGFNVALNYIRKTDAGLKAKGMKITMHGNSPPGGGLSSSAAFVVSATLLTLRANGVECVDEMELVKLSMTSEQMLGMNTGGMDQAASICGKKDHALLVSFRPKLSVETVSFKNVIPKPVFLIANSLAVSVKHLTAPVNYNLRVVEVSIAASILAKKLGVSIAQDGNLGSGTLRGVLEAYFKTDTATPEHLEKMVVIAKEHLRAEGYTTEEAAAALDISVEALKEKYISVFPVKYEKLKLLPRTLHVYQESLRVLQFVDILKNICVDMGSVEALGSLMNESHKSAMHQFQHSHPDVDELIEVARAVGSLGSRVTGAGFGGYTVHLVTEESQAAVIAGLRSQFYEKKFGKMPEDAVLITKPGSGAALLDPKVLD